MMPLQQIAERCQQGDREAFALLYTAMRQPLRAVCMGYVHDEDVADDLLHDAFMLMFYQIGKLKDTSRAEAWMTMVMRRVSLLYLRKRRQQGQKPLSDCTAKALQPLTVDNDAESALAVQEILAAVDALPEGYRQVFRLFVMEGMTHQEIAALTGIEPHSSSSQLVRAKELLRRWLCHAVPVILMLTLPLCVYLWQRSGKGTDQESRASEVGNKTDKMRYTASETQKPQNSQNSQESQKSQKNQEPQKPQDLQESQNSQLQESQNSQEFQESQEPLDFQESHESPPPSIMPAPTPKDSTLIKSPTLPSMSGGWEMALTISGAGNGKDLQLPYSDGETNPLVSDSVAHHHFPLTVGITFSRRIGSHWRVGAGIRYVRMTSDMLTGNTYVAHQHHQLVQYVGFPVSLSWHHPLSRRFSTYLSASASVSLPLHSTLESVWLMNGQPYQPTSLRLHPPVQWSAGIGAGLQYDLTPHLGLFVEPSLNYHFGTSSTNVHTWNTEHPFSLNVPIGLRISF